MGYNSFSQVSVALGKVSQDIRSLLSGTANPGQAILIDYVDRIQKQMLRFSRWGFLLSEPQYFMTTFGQTDYWLGPANTLPVGLVDTTLHLTDVDKLKKNEVRDFSNNKPLKPLGAQPIGSGLNFRSGQSRPSTPAAFVQDWNDPNILHVYPAPDNHNPYQPSPSPPALSYAAGGALPQRTYYVRITLTDSIGGESVGSSVSSFITIPANNLLVVSTPKLFFSTNASGVQYNGYKVYAAQAATLAGSAEGNETFQATGAVAMGSNWNEPGSGLTTNGAAVPTVSTVAPLEGYIIGFRYYKGRVTVTGPTQTLQIPDDYLDVLVHGVNAMAWNILDKSDKAAASLDAYKSGLTEMIWDKNLFPDNDFVRPDPGTFVNQQTLGVLPEEFF